MISRLYLWIGLAAIGVFAVAIFFVNSKSQKTPPSTSQPPPKISPSPASANKFNYQIPAVSKNGIKAYNQFPEKTVFVSEVLLEKPSYIVIFRSDTQGNPGQRLGYGGVFKAGRYPNITMMLNEETKAGDTLLAVLYIDNGDGLYKENEELPVKDEKGNQVMAKFSILPSKK